MAQNLVNPVQHRCKEVTIPTHIQSCVNEIAKYTYQQITVFMNTSPCL